MLSEELISLLPHGLLAHVLVALLSINLCSKASMLYLESPAFVGFSTSNTSSDARVGAWAVPGAIQHAWPGQHQACLSHALSAFDDAPLLCACHARAQCWALYHKHSMQSWCVSKAALLLMLLAAMHCRR